MCGCCGDCDACTVVCVACVCAVFALLKLFLCMICHTMWSGKSLSLLCILMFGILCLSAIRMMFLKIRLAVCILV